MEATDCQPDFCLDLFEPSGHGRRKRTPGLLPGKNDTNSTTEYTRFKENIEYTVIMPGEFDQMKGIDPDQCKNFVLISGLLAMLLAFSTILVSTMSSIDLLHRFSNLFSFCFSLQSCALVSKIQNINRKGVDDFVPTKGYAGRAIVQWFSAFVDNG